MLSFANFRKSAIFITVWSLCHVLIGIERYVVKDNPTPVPNYTNWAEAAPDIQSAIDVSGAGDVILVSNGVYDTGGNSARRVYINKTDITVRSVNGPGVTIIDGLGTNRPVIMTSNSWLIGFTLTNGNAGASYGGGVSGAANSNSFVSNCVIVANMATNSRGGGARWVTMYDCTVYGNRGKLGGGVADSRIYNSVISNNTASEYGGGVHASQMFNCLVIGNSATNEGGGYADSAAMSGPQSYNCTLVNNHAGNRGGGASYGRMYNSILYYNTAVTSGNERYSGQYTNSCINQVTPGDGNITAAPLFVDTNVGNYRLMSVSPCVNAGTNFPWLGNLRDLDGRSRIDRFNGVVDMGCYEYLPRGSIYSVK